MSQQPQVVNVGDIGTNVKVRVLDWDQATKSFVPVDLSAASSLRILLRKPDETVVGFDAAASPADGIGWLKYTTQDGDLDQPGVWEIQGKVQIGIGRWSTGMDTFKVGEALVETP